MPGAGPAAAALDRDADVGGAGAFAAPEWPAGGVVTFPITVTSHHGYSGIMNITCTGSPNTNTLGLPISTQCVSNPPELTMSTNGTGTLSLAIATGTTFSAGVVSRSLPLYLAHIFTTATSQTVSATAVAALRSTTTGMACLLALQGDLNGLTTSQDVSASNGVHVGTQDCALRSDAGINLTGGASVDGNVIAAGQVAISNGASVTPPFTATSNAGQVADPFIGDAAVQSALQAAADASGPNPNCTGAGQPACSLSPGNFTGISVSNGATLTLQPGLYTVKGAVNFGGGTVNIMPGGVTIVSSGSVSISNGVSVNGFERSRAHDWEGFWVSTIRSSGCAVK